MREKMLPSQTLPDFQQYVLSRKLVPERSVTFYAYWAKVTPIAIGSSTARR